MESDCACKNLFVSARDLPVVPPSVHALMVMSGLTVNESTADAQLGLLVRRRSTKETASVLTSRTLLQER